MSHLINTFSSTFLAAKLTYKLSACTIPVKQWIINTLFKFCVTSPFNFLSQINVYWVKSRYCSSKMNSLTLNGITPTDTEKQNAAQTHTSITLQHRLCLIHTPFVFYKHSFLVWVTLKQETLHIHDLWSLSPMPGPITESGADAFKFNYSHWAIALVNSTAKTPTELCVQFTLNQLLLQNSYEHEERRRMVANIYNDT